MRVLVIGGGIGGLCLAHGLLGAGIEVEVYERTTTRDEWLQGYRIHLNPNGCRALHECLPPENWARFEAAAGNAWGGFGFRDEQLRTLAHLDAEMFAGAEGDPVGRHRAMSRIRLREVLLAGLPADVLHLGREFVRYEPTAAGGVRAHFADGGQADGDVLVGADGSNSRVRGQYLPALRRIDTGVLAVAGRYPLTAERVAALPEALTSGASNIMPPHSESMFIAAWRPLTTDGVDAEDYLLWSYIAGRARYPDDVEAIDGVALRDLVLDRIGGWSPVLRTVVADCDPASVGALRIRSMPTLRRWPSSRVTLLGDAIHNMTPMAGIGANTALRDAGVLRRELAGAHLGGGDPVAAVGRYEREMRGYANRAIALSLRNARNAASSARLPRAAFRVVLRTAQAVPPLKRAMFAGHGN